MSDYDVVVIGAGNGGLTAALTLAKAGKKVLLLERHNVPGGCATSFVRGRFEFETALHQLSGMGSPTAPGPLRSILGEMGVMDKLEFVEMKNLYRAVFPGTFDVTLKADREEAIRELQKRFPREVGGIRKFFDLVYEFSMQMIQGLFFHDPEISKEKYPVYFKYAFRNTQEILDEYFESPLLKSIVSMYWGYVGLPPSRLPFGDFAIMLFAYIEFKPYHLKGGSQALSNALLDSFLQAGGEVRFNCAAGKIEVKGGRVAGVLTEDGDFAGTSYVVSNASTIHTCIDLIDREELPAGQLEAFRSSSIGPSAFSVYMGLDCEPGELGIQEATNFITTTTDMDKAFASWRTLDKQGWALLTCYDACDPEFSPAGICQVVVVMLQYADPWYTIPAHRYAEVKYRYADGVIDLAERVFPGIRNHIEEVEAASPLTHMRYLGHPGGAIYGQDQFAKDSAFFLSNRSPVQGLFFAGSWVGSGGFQPTLTSGRSTARSVLKDMRKQ